MFQILYTKLVIICALYLHSIEKNHNFSQESFKFFLLQLNFVSQYPGNVLHMPEYLGIL